MRPRHSIRWSAVALLLVGLIGLARTQPISITGGNQTMTVTTAVIGSEPTAVTNTAVRIRIRRQAAISKVTAQTSCAGQSFNLAVVVTSAPIGTIQPQINLVDGALPLNILTSIPQAGSTAVQTVRIRYTASATFSQGNSAEMGADVHNITYTIIAQ